MGMPSDFSQSAMVSIGKDSYKTHFARDTRPLYMSETLEAFPGALMQIPKVIRVHIHLEPNPISLICRKRESFSKSDDQKSDWIEQRRKWIVFITGYFCFSLLRRRNALIRLVRSTVTFIGGSKREEVNEIKGSESTRTSPYVCPFD